MNASATETIVSNSELHPFLDGGEPYRFSDRLSAFIRQQCAAWPRLREARHALDETLSRRVLLDDLEVQLQHNPDRMRSSASCVDSRSVARRPCFLCPHNLYPQQKALVFRQQWRVLNNPFPIFADHLVVAHQQHVPQSADAAMDAMVSFVTDLGCSFMAFYNGPTCGASAPDHLHFQACPAGSIPMTGQLAMLLKGGTGMPMLVPVPSSGPARGFTGTVDNRTLFVCLSPEPGLLVEMLQTVVGFLEKTTAGSYSPGVNILVSGSAEGYSGILFPRRAHRPSCFYEDGERRMIVSPGAVDMGGLVILPRRQDYAKMDRERMLHIFSEVCCSADIFKTLVF